MMFKKKKGNQVSQTPQEVSVNKPSVYESLATLKIHMDWMSGFIVSKDCATDERDIWLYVLKEKLHECSKITNELLKEKFEEVINNYPGSISVLPSKGDCICVATNGKSQIPIRKSALLGMIKVALNSEIVTEDEVKELLEPSSNN